MRYIFDGTYPGFLTCIFESFARKDENIHIVTESTKTSEIFQKEREIISDPEKARRVISGLEKKAGPLINHDILKVFLSEDLKAWNASFAIIQQIFKTDADILHNYGNPDVLYFSQTLKKVNREHHRMKAFVRFSKSSNGLYYALIEPDFNVIPLITNFFRQRFADQLWLIYDVKREYGVYYNLKSVEEVKPEKLTSPDQSMPVETVGPDENDRLYSRLWQSYFKSTNIEPRKNLKLHLRHVPIRYWKYLTEKQCLD